MANLTPASTFDNVYQIENTDLVVDTVINTPMQQLTNRTEWLRNNMPTFQQARQSGRNTVLTGRFEFGIEQVFGATLPNTMRLYATLDPLIFTASQGFDIRGEVVHTVRLDTDLDLVMDAGTGTRYGVLIYTPTPTPSVQFVTVQAVHATGTVPGGSGTMIWYNPITGRTDWNNGSAWLTNVLAVVVGEWQIASGDINTASIVTYPFRSELYTDSISPGTVISLPSATAPRGGWLLCNGAQVNREYYARLFKAIGTAHGAGNGFTTFNIPDYRAEFLRGNDNGRGIDTGRVLGSSQAQGIQSHAHSITQNGNDAISPTGTVTNFRAGGDTAASASTGSTGGTETRPRNVSTNFWIKY